MKSARLHSVGIVYFDAVRRAGSIREAARRLNVAGSAVNRQIIKLEEEIGVPLFDRLASGVRLTAAGESFARHVMLVLQDAERFAADVDLLMGVQAGHISVAAAEGICASILPDVVTVIHKRAPRITLDIRRTGSLEVARTVLEGDVDVGIAFDLAPPAGLQSVLNMDFGMGVVMRSDHPLAARDTIPLSACLEYPLIMHGGAISIGQLLEPAFVRLRVTPVAAVTSNSIDMTRELVERGVGIAFQTNFGLDRALDDGTLKHIPLDAGGPVFSRLGVYVRAQRSLPMAIDLFLQHLSEALKKRQQMSNTLRVAK